MLRNFIRVMPPLAARHWMIGCLASGLSILLPSNDLDVKQARGQEPAVQAVPQAAGQPSPAAIKAAQAAAAAKSQAGGPPAGADGDKPGKPGPGDKPAKEGEKEPAGSKTIQRPNEPTEPPDPKELTVRPDADEKIAFSFRNQPWLAILEWFAEISDMPLDWRELPGDHVNISSFGRYSLDEVRDLLNRHLLARGYVMLRREDGLMVLKTAEINAALVPRVDKSELSKLPPHDFVRTSLDVGWLSAEKLAEELKPMVSANGKLTALTTTNRIEAMDAAVNLQQIAELLAREQSDESRQDLAPEFMLRHVSASDVKEMLEQFLGLEKKEAPMTPQQMQMMQQMQQRQGGKPPPAKEKEPAISIVANERRNSIILQAPVDRVAIAAEFIKRVDVPTDAMVSLADVESRVEAFRLTSLDPEKLLEIVRGMNILEPMTHIQVDSDNKALIVSGSLADRYIVRSLIERLDGSGRQFYVLPIRYRDPRAVAESIGFLIGNDDKKESNNNRNRYSYFGMQQEKKEEPDKFRVAADVRFKQVLLWANEYEMEDVSNLLVKLGELPPPGGNQQTVRVMDAAAVPETYEYLKRLQTQFERLAPNRVELPSEDDFPAPKKVEISEESETDADIETPRTDAQPKKETPRVDPLEASTNQLTQSLAQFRAPPATPLNEPPIDQPPPTAEQVQSGKDFDRLFGERADAPTAPKDTPPIQIQVDAEGRILLTSPDTEALDKLESLMMRAPPPKRPYHVFHVKHASAYWMETNLKLYFEDAEEDDGNNDPFTRWYFDLPEDDDETPAGLGADQPLKFLADIDTSTIVVTGASPEQLRTIEELIELWDVPEPLDQQKARYTKLVTVHYSRAEKIAETVKDAYRDLLSSNDKAFGQGKPKGQQGGAENVEKSRNGPGAGLVDQGGKEGGGSDFTFKGKLSVGVDEVGNTLLVSAEGEPLLDLIVDMIRQLDDAAKTQGNVQVHRTSGTIRIDALESALGAFTEAGAAPPNRRSPQIKEATSGNGETTNP
ncbi:Bacterial type II/III secretion system short domain protein [Roseimaritima multifibrata]|uniref:Bacterial type II/III secretion system short domain protein n=1 Tax=Roseimaritima multifibrata TaxID=1930274 RepID=A0A517MB96_9BACT|nr:Bacterial type II/III secretion system short domain protein [Roseimaritima multifibrata]